MYYQSRSPRAVQLDLFSPPEETPSWTSLPAGVRQQIRKLVNVMLQTHATRLDNRPPSSEVADE